jgi:hypothetical protein
MMNTNTTEQQMFAIQSGTKFINARFYIDPNSVFEITISGKPKTYKTRSEVDRVMKLVHEYVNKSIASIQKSLISEQTAVARAEKDAARLTARLAELVEQPYKTVAKKVALVERQIERAHETVKANSVGYYQKDLRRLEQIRASGATVVKMQ